MKSIMSTQSTDQAAENVQWQKASINEYMTMEKKYRYADAPHDKYVHFLAGRHTSHIEDCMYEEE